MFLYGGLQAGKSTEVKRTDIYYISICIRPIRTLLHLTSPGDQFWMEVLYCTAGKAGWEQSCCSWVWKVPCSAEPVLGALSFLRVPRTAWTHHTSKSELFALSKQRWMKVGLSLFTLQRVRLRSGVFARLAGSPLQQKHGLMPMADGSEPDLLGLAASNSPWYPWGTHTPSMLGGTHMSGGQLKSPLYQSRHCDVNWIS